MNDAGAAFSRASDSLSAQQRRQNPFVQPAQAPCCTIPRTSLAAFVDDADDWQHADVLRKMCTGGVELQELNPHMAKLRSLRGLVRGDALTVPYYWNSKLGEWVDSRLSDERVSRVVVFSSAMAQYAISHCRGSRRCIIDFVDVDSDKWRQYASSRRWPMSWLYAREGRCLLEYDRAVAAQTHASVFVSAAEAALFARCWHRNQPHGSVRSKMAWIQTFSTPLRTIQTRMHRVNRC